MHFTGRLANIKDTSYDKSPQKGGGRVNQKEIVCVVPTADGGEDFLKFSVAANVVRVSPADYGKQIQVTVALESRPKAITDKFAVNELTLTGVREVVALGTK
jgi:hypothetical protein